MARDAVFGSFFAGIRYNIIDENSNRFESDMRLLLLAGSEQSYRRHLILQET